MVWKHWLMCQPLWDFLWGKYCWNNYDWWSVVFPAMWTGRWPGGQQGGFSATWPSPDCIKASSSAHTLAHYYNFSQNQHLHDLSRSSLHTINIMVQCVCPRWPRWPHCECMATYVPLFSPSELYGPQLCLLESVQFPKQQFFSGTTQNLQNPIATCPVHCAQCADCRLHQN